MPPLKPGFYVATAETAADMIAGDLQGPFPTLWELCEWLAVSGVAYRPWRRAARIVPLYAGEMTDRESAGPWATAVSAIR